ncbi:FHS family L-fucose permease-like MFS transporter [Pedobacter cryoconitis]|uniref:FHS family L-fucose permease-like MFS transporter n=1 Tax=Pedobacter cryoconitis TaxID=188932 RepID=A0A7W8YVZ6_9SPHI|nr:L-fucose:H+ symporter permease [Pedobacter cryoconitis]MBB5622648.1 FHS family L-fucose permease-like MFS transporter [Pedobacter cryoconitis]MBB5648801.1 FHS family L-fucose permease-like MFS transporter [Pedobacter cryoconitis]
MRKNQFAVVLIISLFFLWGFALNLNPILIPHLKKACQLSDTQSAFIDSASYIAYFLLAIPAGKFMKRFGYKGGIVLGLLLFATGAFLFYPAAVTRSYVFFLIALFIIASGLAFLETAANPYITVLGDEKGATQRLNFAQSFNGLASTLAPFLGGMFILSGQTLDAKAEAAMSPEQLNTYLNHEASSVKIPFLIIGAVVLLVAVFLIRTPLPEIEDREGDSDSGGSLLKEKNLMLGVTAQFFYVGAQVCVASFFIRFSAQVAGIAEKSAALYLSGALLGFMAGRFIGTFLMQYISPSKLLAIYSVINIALIFAAVTTTGMTAVYALLGVEFFMSIMFPTIFSLSIRGLGSRMKEGSSLVIMAIVGGAVFPVIMGKVSDMTNIHTAYIVPAACFAVVLYFALTNLKVKKIKLTTAH